MLKEHRNISEILKKSRMKSKEMIGNDKLNIGLNKKEHISQVQQVSNELI